MTWLTLARIAVSVALSFLTYTWGRSDGQVRGYRLGYWAGFRNGYWADRSPIVRQIDSIPVLWEDR